MDWIGVALRVMVIVVFGFFIFTVYDAVQTNQDNLQIAQNICNEWGGELGPWDAGYSCYKRNNGTSDHMRIFFKDGEPQVHVLD